MDGVEGGHRGANGNGASDTDDHENNGADAQCAEEGGGADDETESGAVARLLADAVRAFQGASANDGDDGGRQLQ